MMKLILSFGLCLMTSSAFATMHYNCNFALKTGEKLQVFAYSDINFIEIQSNVAAPRIIEQVKMVEGRRNFFFRSGSEEIISIAKGQEGQKVIGRLNHQSMGKITGRCTSFEDIGP